MEPTQEEIETWLKRIEDTFAGPQGICGERALALAEAEKQNRQKLVKVLHSYIRLMDAFFDFSLQTLEEIHSHNPPPDLYGYSLCLASFWRFRSASNTFFDGYYSEATAHLRSVFENIFTHAAVAYGEVTWKDLYNHPSYTSPTQFTDKKIKKEKRQHRTDLEKRIKVKVFAVESGFSKQQCEIVESQLENLHSHVHRAEARIAQVYVDLATQRKPVFLVPTVEDDRVREFVMMSEFAGWCFTRTLRATSRSSLFSENWNERYQVLDASFRFSIQRFQSGSAFQAFVNTKMSFGTTLRLPTS